MFPFILTKQESQQALAKQERCWCCGSAAHDVPLAAAIWIACECPPKPDRAGAKSGCHVPVFFRRYALWGHGNELVERASAILSNIAIRFVKEILSFDSIFDIENFTQSFLHFPFAGIPLKNLEAFIDSVLRFSHDT